FQMARARTSVPWWDQWAFIQELAQHQQGKPPGRFCLRKWGPDACCSTHADEHWGNLASLTWLLMLLQFFHIGLLIAVAWMLIGRRSVIGFVVTGIVILISCCHRCKCRTSCGACVRAGGESN